MTTADDELLDRFARRERRALARILTLAEQGRAPPVPARAGKPAIVVGLTGSGGVGKSTLVAALVDYLRREKHLSVAVVASDPASPLSGGALLGDRIRVRLASDDEGVYFRSLSTRGAAGGVSAATRPAIAWLAAFGFDVILVETVGVGQDQVGVRQLVDTLVLVVTPNSGDEVQWEKAGLIELADLVVINKADLPGADRLRNQLLAALSLSPEGRVPPLLSVTALSGQGVAELWQAIDER